MNKSSWLAILLMACTFLVHCQDEGSIVKRERIDKSKGVFLAVGPSLTLGKNIGDYSTGFNIEAGFLKRLNRVFSIGPSLSYVNFKYDQDVTFADYNNWFLGGPYDNGGIIYYQGLYFELAGGDISLISAALNLKLNLIPIKDNSKFSVYGFAKPFISYSSRTEVTGIATFSENIGDPDVPEDWYLLDEFDWYAGSPYALESYGIDISDDLNKQSQVTGGIFIGPGIEFAPVRKISGFFQVSIGYTFPISFVSTESFASEGENDLNVFIDSGRLGEYPVDKAGFPSVSFQLGVSYNF